MFRLKISKADRLFSLWIRHRDKYKCVRCGRQHNDDENTSDNSHYWQRSIRGTRFDPLNCDTLCKMPCHSGNKGWEHEKRIKDNLKNKYDGEYTEFKKNQLGERDFDLLLVRAHTPTKVDEKLMAIYWKERLKKDFGVKVK